jgi:two-component system NtrC family sensor kinase
MSRGARILLVEDSPTQAVRMAWLLERRGWQVATAASAEEALTRLNADRPDLLLVDQHLPGMQGVELCRRVRGSAATARLPLLILTVDDAAIVRAEAGAAADDCLGKGVEDELLLLRIEALLGGADAGSGAPGRILVVDDSSTYRTFLAESLREDGYAVATATGGEHGLAQATAAHFDCVIVDLIMPGVGGIEVCQRLGEMRARMENPFMVLILTARETRDDMTRGLESGADDFVGKSNDMAVLKARIRALLRRKLYQEERRRMQQELKERELEALRARADREIAEARMALVDQLEAANRELTVANARLREAQSQLVHSEKMASLGQLVAGIAHEINNPLGFAISNVFTVRSGLDKLLEGLGAPLTPDLGRRADKMRARLDDAGVGLDRVKDLVVKLRTFSRLDASLFGTLDIAESIDMICRILSDRLRRIEVVTSLRGRPQIDCYAGELNQVLLNLMVNATDAVGEHGRIEIATEEEGNSFVIRVRDNGCGMPAEVAARIFEPFFTTKPVGHGTGLGLSISYSIIQTHRGEITVTSAPGEGTEFRIALPLDLRDERAAG